MKGRNKKTQSLFQISIYLQKKQMREIGSTDKDYNKYKRINYPLPKIDTFELGKVKLTS